MRFKIEIGQRFTLELAGLRLFGLPLVHVRAPWPGEKVWGWFWDRASGENVVEWPPAYAETRRTLWDDEGEDFGHEMRDEAGAWKPAVRCRETGEWSLASVLRSGSQDDRQGLDGVEGATA